MPCCACHCKILQLYSRVRAVSTGLKLRYQIIWIVARLMPFHLAYSHGFITHACLCEKQIYMSRLCFYGSRFSIGLWIDYCDCVHNNREDNVFLIVCVFWYICWILMICIYYLLRIQSRIACILLLKSKMKNRTPSIDAEYCLE